MRKNEIDNLLMFLKSSLKDEEMDKEATNKLKYLYEEILNFKNELPTIEQLERLKKIEIELETKYEKLYEFGNYFDPIFIRFKKIIHENAVSNVRKENRERKRGEIYKC